MKTTPREGDYVRKEGLTEDKYLAVGNAFVAAGFSNGEFPNYHYIKMQGVPFFGISKGKLYHSVDLRHFPDGRELSLSDLLGDDDLPGEDSPTWNGCGNPLNGTECEVSTYDKDTWLGCTVLFIGSQHCVLQYPGREEAYHLKHIKFRPLKSEREIAIEEMLNINKWSVTLEQNNAMKRLCEQLYDAGYRRVEK